MNSLSTATIVERVRKRQRHHRPVLVAIDGAGGSGKSTLAAQLMIDLTGDAALIAMDDFIVRDRMLDDSWERGWDRDRLRAQVLDPLTRGERLAYERFDWERNALGETMELEPALMIIVEGITCLHPDLESYWHLRVWVETPPEIARERGRARDADNENAQHWNHWALNDARYRREYRPHQRAHVVVHSA